MLILIFFMCLPMAHYAQTAGCKDPLAANYMPEADSNDGSCLYTNTTYTPPVKTDPVTDSLSESSGLVMAGNYLWSINDGGGTATVYRIDSSTGNLLQRVLLQNAQNIDWEEITFDGKYFYVADVGNNKDGARTDLKIYKFPLAAIADYTANPFTIIAADKIEIISFTYSNQPQPPVPADPNSTAFDCEAMIVEKGQIHLFTKNWTANTTTHYTINTVAAGTYIAQEVETFNTQFLVTGAAKTSGAGILALLGYQSTGFGNHYLYLVSAYSNGNYFNGNKRKINLPSAAVMGQAEGIAFIGGGYGYISNELFAAGSIFEVKQKLRSFSIDNFITALSYCYFFNGDGNWSDGLNWENIIKPPPMLHAGSEIIINPATGGKCRVDVPYSIPAGCSLLVMPDKDCIINGNLIIQ